MGNPSIAKSSGQSILSSLEKAYLSKKYDLYIHELQGSRELFPLGVYHYNLGTAYFKKEQFPLARYHLEKALGEGIVHSGVHKNLEATVQKLDIQSVQESSYFKDRALDQILRFPQDFSVTISLFLFLIVVILMHFDKIKRKVVIIFFALLLCPPAALWFVKAQYKRAVVMEQAYAYEGPSRSFEVSSDLPAGVIVIIKRQSEDWFYIDSPVHFSGWINGDQLGIL